MVEGEKVTDCYCSFRSRRDLNSFEIGIFEDKTNEGTVYKCGLGFESCSVLKTYNMLAIKEEKKKEILGEIDKMTKDIEKNVELTNKRLEELKIKLLSS
jgi:hypothetical protein